MMYGSCNTRHGKQNFLSFWAIFLHLTLLTTQKINIFKKMKKKKKTLWRDYHFTLVYHKWWSYDVWFLRHGAQNTNFFVIFNYFFYPKTTRKIKILKKWKKKARDITIFHMSTMNDNHMMYGSWNTKCTKNQDHMLYYSWDMVCEGCNHYFSIWAIFFPLTPGPLPPLTTPNNNILKKWKNHLEMSSFYTCVPKIIIIWYTLPETWCATDIIFCHFGQFFTLLPHYLSQKQNLEKK